MLVRTTSSENRIMDWLVVGVVLLIMVGVLWAAVPPSPEKDLVIGILMVGDLIFWASPVVAFVRWVNGLRPQ